MRGLWIRRLWGIGAGLLAATLAAWGLAAVLGAAGDFVGQQALLGVAAMTGIAFVMDLIVLCLCSARLASHPDQRESS